MSDSAEYLTPQLPNATPAQKKVFFQALVCLSGIDGRTDPEEIDYIAKIAHKYNVDNFAEICNFKNDKEVIENARIIDSRPLALELLRKLCMLAHVDSVLSDEETLFIGKIGRAMNVEMDKIEQISEWVVERLILRAQAKLIFEEKA
ncbi:MAG: TerB family tellurite resistance protein [Alphaproteobacteria bacterium]|nr:TerB family tellurite resistance protein [Alphaproteobacteria bacterium]MBR1756164.1 TerB family tellurite resistance protein [Alphaproteobacteria bacterium]